MAFRDLGNCPTFEFKSNVETKEHFSSRSGIRSKDKTAVQTKGGTLRIVMEEFTAENLALAVLGAVSTNTAGQDKIKILSEDVIAARVKFVGTTDVGRRATWTYHRVEFAASEAINLINEDWMGMTITGEVLEDAVEGFGHIVFDAQSTAGDDPPDIGNYTIGQGIVSIELI